MPQVADQPRGYDQPLKLLGVQNGHTVKEVMVEVGHALAAAQVYE